MDLADSESDIIACGGVPGSEPCQVVPTAGCPAGLWQNPAGHNHWESALNQDHTRTGEVDRVIAHVDMDAFYASVEQRDHPALRGKPVIVGGTGPRGVVAAASYEARRFGVRSAMPSGRARRLCPEGVFVRPEIARYREVSRAVFAVFHEFTALVEGLSLDEAFLDVSACDGSPVSLARELKQRIAARVGLTASVGIAHNKLLAKLASDYDKPDGLVHVPFEDVQRFLDPLPVRRLWGVGRQTTGRLHDLGVLTIGQLRAAPSDLLVQALGNRAGELQQLARGIDRRSVKPSRAIKSISQEETFDRDCTDIGELRRVMAGQAELIAHKLGERGLFAHTVTIKIRAGGFSTVTRSESLQGYTADAGHIVSISDGLLERWASMRPSFAVRLIGVGVSGLTRYPDPDEVFQFGTADRRSG